MRSRHHDDDHDAVARRAGRREANLRALNERIADSQTRLRTGSDTLTLLCECAIASCDATVELPHRLFSELRGDAARYAVIEGHILYDVERVVHQGPGWTVVEKHGPARRAAEDATA